jgi:clan AA aspartic protease (TIGR02281 family)
MPSSPAWIIAAKARYGLHDGSGERSSIRLAAGTRQELLRRAIERDAGYAPYHAALGDALDEQRRPAEALSRWSVAAQLDPGLHGELAPKMKEARRRVDSADGVVVPLISNGHSYFVDARINDRRQWLLLDTGASFSAISPELAETLGIDVASAARRVRLSTANGMITAPVVHLGRINLNGAAVDDLEAVVLEQLNGPGVLGLNFLNHFNIDINQADGEMTLRR